MLERQGVVQTPMQLGRFTRRFHSIHTTGHHQLVYPQYSLPHQARPPQRLCCGWRLEAYLRYRPPVLNVKVSGIIGQEAARDFYEHSQRWTNNYDVGQVISTKAVRCIDGQIQRRHVELWLQTLTVATSPSLLPLWYTAGTVISGAFLRSASRLEI